MSELAAFNVPTAKLVLRGAQRALKISSGGFGFEGFPDNPNGKPTGVFRITGVVDIAYNTYAAVEVTFDEGALATVDDGIVITSGSPLQILGPPMKAGLIVAAFFDLGSWIGYGYEWRVLDWDAGPLVIADGKFQWKTKVTADGITWTQETKPWDGTVC